MNKQEKFKKDERGAALVVWSVIIILVVVILALIFWANDSGPQVTSAADTASAVPITASVQATPINTTPVSAPTSTSSTTDSINNLKNNEHMITIQTNKGTIVFETFDADAPTTVANFIKLANEGFYNGVIFHRVIQGFMIQGGDPTGTGTGGPGYTFADELNPATPSYQAGYVRGTVAMANAGPNTNGSQFFIMQKDTPLPHNYTIFGRVTSGIDVVDAIATTPVDGSDKPLTPIVMQKVTVTTTTSTQ
jgi:cyclophilin family peptidyl-prolyl cis-trans isomerase